MNELYWFLCFCCFRCIHSTTMYYWYTVPHSPRSWVTKPESRCLRSAMLLIHLQTLQTDLDARNWNLVQLRNPPYSEGSVAHGISKAKPGEKTGLKIGSSATQVTLDS